MKLSQCVAFCICAFISMPLSLLPQKAHNIPQANDIVVNASLQSWMDGYLAWMHHIPHAPGTTATDHINVAMPVLSLYAPDLHPLYSGAKAKQNAEFLDKLDVVTAPADTTSILAPPTPSLADYLEFIPELRSYKTGLVKAHDLILLAVTYPDKPFCAPENAALIRFKSRAHKHHIQVVEVRLHAQS